MTIHIVAQHVIRKFALSEVLHVLQQVHVAGLRRELDHASSGFAENELHLRSNLEERAAFKENPVGNLQFICPKKKATKLTQAASESHPTRTSDKGIVGRKNDPP